MNVGGAGEKIQYHPGLVGALRGFQPVIKPKASDWAQKEFRLSADYSATTNIIELDPFQIEPLNCVSDPRVRQITICSSTQLMKTLIMQIGMAWAMKYEPGPMLFVGFKDDDVKKFAEERFISMCRDNVSLRDVMPILKKRDSRNRSDKKTFKGGSVDFVGSNSDSNLARRTIMWLFMDEVDKYENDAAGSEGNRIELARARLARYESRSKLMLACSPTLRGSSDIWAEYEQSDQRVGLVDCWDCHHGQRLHWAGVDFNSKLSPYEAGQTACYVCEKCRRKWNDEQRRWAVKNTFRWHAREKFYKHAGFWINHLYSLMPVHSMPEMTEHFMKVQNDPSKHMVFKNTRLAELWEQSGSRPSWETFEREGYQIVGDVLLPAGVHGLVAGVDVQGSRIEMQVLGFGLVDGIMNFWVVDYQVIELFEDNGTAIVTSSQLYWDEVDKWLRRVYRHPSGARLPILCMAIDSAHQSDAVYLFALNKSRINNGLKGVFVNQPQTVVCIRGRDEENLVPIHKVSDRETARVRQGPGKDMPIVTLGTGYLKTMIYGMIGSKDSGRTIHISSQLGDEYMRQLTAERKVVLANRIEWIKVYTRNEALDTAAYALGAYYLCRADKWTDDEWQQYYLNRGLKVHEVDPTAHTVVTPSYLD